MAPAKVPKKTEGESMAIDSLHINGDVTKGSYIAKFDVSLLDVEEKVWGVEVKFGNPDVPYRGGFEYRRAGNQPTLEEVEELLIALKSALKQE